MLWKSQYAKFTKIDGEWVKELDKDGSTKLYEMFCKDAVHFNDYNSDVMYHPDSELVEVEED